MKKLFTAVTAFAVLVVPATAQAQSTDPSITLIHGIPGTTVDLVVDGTVVLDGFAPGSMVDITSFAGRTLNNVELVDDDSGDVVIGPLSTFDVPDAGNWSSIVHLDADGEPALSQFENNVAATPSGEARLTVRHTAAAPAVDLIVGTDRPITDMANGTSEELELPVGTVSDAAVAPTGDDPILELANIALAANTNTIVYVIGSAADDTLDVVTQSVALPASTGTGSSTSSTTSTTAPTPTGVNTGSPLDGGATTTLLLVMLGGLVLAGASLLARRRV